MMTTRGIDRLEVMVWYQKEQHQQKREEQEQTKPSKGEQFLCYAQSSLRSLSLFLPITFFESGLPITFFESGSRERGEEERK